MPGLKKINEYAGRVADYDRIPKAVFAAIAVSLLTGGGDHFEGIDDAVMREWACLHLAGIVPQKPSREVELP